MEDTKEIDIDLTKIFYMMRKKVVFIVIITLALGILAGGITHFFIKPTYTATAKLYVYSNTDRVSSDTSITYNEITASQELVNTYIYVLESDTVLDKVAKDLNLDASAKDIRKMISASKVEETQAFQVKVNSTDANLSAKIANSIAKNAPDEIVRVVKAGGVEVIDYAKVPENPSSPNLKKNILVGAMIGFLVSFCSFFIFEMFDTTITNSKDMERNFSLPILGVVPELDVIEQKTLPSSINIISKPSDTLLDNLNNMKGDDSNV